MIKKLTTTICLNDFSENDIRSYYSNLNSLDSSEVYDLGTSLNSIGNKIFTINKEELKEVATILIEKFN